MTEFDRLREIVTDRWPYRFTYAEYWEARRRLGLGVGIRTNGEGVRFSGHLNRAAALEPYAVRLRYAGSERKDDTVPKYTPAQKALLVQLLNGPIRPFNGQWTIARALESMALVRKIDMVIDLTPLGKALAQTLSKEGL